MQIYGIYISASVCMYRVFAYLSISSVDPYKRAAIRQQLTIDIVGAYKLVVYYRCVATDRKERCIHSYRSSCVDDGRPADSDVPLTGQCTAASLVAWVPDRCFYSVKCIMLSFMRAASLEV
jgi:hypothetical protein